MVRRVTWPACQQSACVVSHYVCLLPPSKRLHGLSPGRPTPLISFWQRVCKENTPITSFIHLWSISITAFSVLLRGGRHEVKVKFPSLLVPSNTVFPSCHFVLEELLTLFQFYYRWKDGKSAGSIFVPIWPTSQIWSTWCITSCLRVSLSHKKGWGTSLDGDLLFRRLPLQLLLVCTIFVLINRMLDQ